MPLLTILVPTVFCTLHNGFPGRFVTIPARQDCATRTVNAVFKGPARFPQRRGICDNFVAVMLAIGDPPAASNPIRGPGRRALRLTLELPPDTDADNADAHERELATKEKALLDALAAAKSDDARRDAALDAAAFILGRRCEAALSRLLHGCPDDDDARTVASRTTLAMGLLSKLPPPAATAPGESRPDPQHDAELLTSLGLAFAAIAAAPPVVASNDAAVRQQLSAACQRLAAYIDDPRPRVSSAARCIQAACYRRAGRADRALEILTTAGARGSPTAFDLFGSVEETRAIADQGGYVAALALAARMETRCATTVATAHRLAAVNTFRALRRSLLIEWADALEKKGDGDAALRARQDAERLTRSFHDLKSVPVLRLGSALPDAGLK